ncbi:Mini-ribonuclease 3 [Lacrimispora saccharolytica]|uniref:Mini-ribonuclease 3 n=1 Tax=Lacrimispora saccharolytica TaxID=84030 RepID=UPI00265CAE51|nr:ribonuclease III domain-containing protein [Lacrimispora saccharolytica]MCF2656026.1 ribonuclease III [Lacrimispora saccharolytica]
MGESLMSFLDEIKLDFKIEDVDINTYSPLTLAFIGDCVFDLVIRSVIVCRANRQPNKLHKLKANVVKAQTQSEMAKALMDDMTEEEAAVYKRGRNAHSFSSAKNASIQDYRRATGLEALVGYLYLLNRSDRILELISLGLRKLEIDI